MYLQQLSGKRQNSLLKLSNKLFDKLVTQTQDTFARTTHTKTICD